MGSFVPAQSCILGSIDAIYTRIGAADDLANAQSTFMLEMTEAAQILQRAGPQSLVLMDEIGRGTSTFDGLALAGAIATHLHDRNQSFVLFATHYFELTEWVKNHPQAQNMHFSAVESGKHIAFLHELQAGPASQSYGVQVAKLAGIPTAVIRQAKQALENLHMQHTKKEAQIDLFATTDAASATSTESSDLDHELLHYLRDMNPDQLSPRDALEALYELKRILEK
jgi:DNA mismatch repair protein MutS